MIIAIDGPAGAGKSTIAKKIAEKLNITFLNSGSFYRGLALFSTRNQLSFTDEEAITELAQHLIFDYKKNHLIINGEDVESLLHTEEMSFNASKISCIVSVRHIVNQKIQELTKLLSIVCEGRDMTTVVFPNAEHKFYLDASLDAQAQRRYSQYQAQGKKANLDQIKQSIQQRDMLDKNKAEGSLKIAPDAIYIDSTHLTIEQICAIIITKI
ncbi:MAG: (d)CMP kinase [Treponemataceae bacterium]